MSLPVTPKVTGIIATIIVAVVVLAIIVGGVLFVAELTPNKLNLGGIEVGGVALNKIDAGDGTTLADMKLKDLFGAIKSLSKDADTLEKQYGEQGEVATDLTNVESTLASSNAPKTADGKIDYNAVLEQKVVYTEEKTIEYSSSELGGIVANLMDSMSKKASLDAPSNLYASTVLRSLTAQDLLEMYLVKLVSINIVTEGSKNFIKFAVKIDLSNLSAELAKQIPEQILSLLGNKVPSALFIEAKTELFINNNSLSYSQDLSLTINDNATLTAIVMNLFGDQLGAAQAQVADAIGGMFCKLVNNLGKIQSISNGKIILLTYTQADIA